MRKIFKNRYSVDKVEYSSIGDVSEIRSAQKRIRFKNLFHEKIHSAKAKNGRRIYYNSFFGGRPIDGVSFFSEMDEILGELGGTLTYLEIAEDTYFQTEAEAISAFHKMRKKIYLAYGRDVYFIPLPRLLLGEGFFYEGAFYLGARGVFQLVIYPRYCKVNGRPILRKEWRISGRKRILSMIGVNHEKNIPCSKICYSILKQKYFRSGELNQNRVTQLLNLRSAPSDIENILDFQIFRKTERERDLSGECVRYCARLKFPTSYYVQR